MIRLQPTRRQFLQTTATTTAAVGLGCLNTTQLPAALAGNDSDADQSGWINLFDGRSLEGWHKNPQRIGHGTGGNWAVEDGAIAGWQDPPGSGNGGILLTDRKFGNFELTIDMKPDWGVCSGLFLRGNDLGRCFQMMVDYHDRGNVGHIYGEGTGGFNTAPFGINGKYDAEKRLVGLTTFSHNKSGKEGLVYSCDPAEWLEAWKLDDWNTARVRVAGKHPQITTWINGVKICAFDGEGSDAPNYDKAKVHSTLGASGSIAVQVHGGKGWPKDAKCRWKNIRIRLINS